MANLLEERNYCDKKASDLASPTMKKKLILLEHEWSDENIEALNSLQDIIIGI